MSSNLELDQKSALQLKYQKLKSLRQTKAVKQIQEQVISLSDSLLASLQSDSVELREDLIRVMKTQKRNPKDLDNKFSQIESRSVN